MESYTFRAMNSDIILAADGQAQAIEAGFISTQRFIDTCEKRFSRFLVDSELSRLNRSQGHWFIASPELFELVKLSKKYYERTGGLFDPSILTDLKRAGYDRSMDEIRQVGLVPDFSDLKNNIESLPNRPYFGMIQMDDELSTLWLPEGLEIDLGGIAKGWIAEKAAEQLAKSVSACAVSAGGDLVLIGLPIGQERWEIELEDPRNPDETLTTLKVGPGAVATSSIVKRSWRQGQKVRHHLIDPRTGEPADTDWLSVTVIAPQAVIAEVFAKVLLIAGSKEAMELYAWNQDISFIAVDQNGSMWSPQNNREYFNDPQ